MTTVEQFLSPECGGWREELERERLVFQILRARSRSEIAGARTALQTWVEAHPEDTAIVYGFDDLWMSEHVLDTLEAESRNEAEPLREAARIA